MIKIFHGKNTFLSYREARVAIEDLISEYEKEETPYDVKTIDASSAEASEIINELETPSLFQQQKILFIKRLSQSRDKDKLREYIENVNNERELPEDIIIWETEKVRGNTRYLKSFEDSYESPDLNKRTFISWAKKEAKKYDFALSKNALYLLAERTNYEPERFMQELKKLSLTKKKKINEDTIDKLCPNTLEHTIWELIDYINDDQAHKAAKRMQDILDQGNDPFFVLLMITRNLRLIFLTKRFMEKGQSLGQIAKKTKTPPFAVKKVMRSARKTSYGRIKKLYEKLYNIDYSGKTGQLDVQLALDILLSVI